jgi:predicted transcriptional regulator
LPNGIRNNDSKVESMEPDYKTMPLADLCELLSNKTLELLKRIERKDFEAGFTELKREVERIQAAIRQQKETQMD